MPEKVGRRVEAGGGKNLKRRKKVAVVSMKHLLEAGVHFGHQTRRWHPKMKRYIFTERNGIYIIDLQKTLANIEIAHNFIRDLVTDGGSILFVGTKKQAQEAIEEHATRCGMPFVNYRWLGGMLTNWQTIKSRIDRMNQLEEMYGSEGFTGMPKKEAMMLKHELEKLKRNLSGIKSMDRLPSAVFVIDSRKEHIPIMEARKLEIPVVALVDTNCDPDEVDFVIPGNDDAIRAGNLISRIIADAVIEGQQVREMRMREAAEAAAETGEAPELEEEKQELTGEAAAEVAREMEEAAAAAEKAAEAGPEK